jgi:hypothetical protein
VALLEKRRFLYNHSGDFPQVILIVPSHVPNMKFLEDLYFVRFCDEINFEKSKKSPRKHQQGGTLEDSYSHEKFI